MSDNRTPRSATKRSSKQRPMQWRPPELLPEPDKQPGFAYRWIRVSLLNNADPRNISSKLREGWEPVSVEEQPELRMQVDPRTRFENSVEIGGLLLCKAPIEMMRQRREYFRNRTDQQMSAVDNNFLSENDPRMPLFQERKSTHTFGSGE